MRRPIPRSGVNRRFRHLRPLARLAVCSAVALLGAIAAGQAATNPGGLSLRASADDAPAPAPPAPAPAPEPASGSGAQPATTGGSPGAPGAPSPAPSEPPAGSPGPGVVAGGGIVPDVVLPAPPTIQKPTVFEVLGPHDLLEISVFDLDQFSRTVRVADDGSITLPFLGRIEVRGLTRGELEQKIAGLLGDKYINDPQVSVFVKEYESRKISVSGAVKTPSSFQLMGPKTLLDVVSEAGGFTQDVGRTVYVIRRRDDGGTDRIVVDLESLIYGGDTTLNVPILPGDVVYAPLEAKITVYVNGAVKEPGGYDFKYGDQITVLRAITKAGGTTERAAERHIQILRRHGAGDQSVIPVDLKKVRSGKIPDPVLLPEDVIDVPEAFF